MARLTIFPVQPERLSHCGPNAGLGLAQDVPLVFEVDHELSRFDADHWFQIQPPDDCWDV
jgi:hypothetical protein